MRRTSARFPIQKQSGQTLIIALLILGILLVLGAVFAGIVSRNINQTSRAKSRTVASDLAESGVRYAHAQLQNSALGADWRPAVVPLAVDATGFTRDPDARYLRGGTGYIINGSIRDQGGPDGLGPFSRINFERGRALVRVRYAPADAALFSGRPTGALRDPGRARSYLIIESVGRGGNVKANDPSTFAAQGVQVANLATQADFNREWTKLGQFDNQNAGSRRVIAMAQSGLVEQLRFITNLNRTSAPAEIGSPTTPNAAGTGRPEESLGVVYEGVDVRPVSIFGGLALGNTADSVGTGGLYSNADVVFHGRSDIFLNPNLGDGIYVNGEIKAANAGSELTIASPGNPNVVLNQAGLTSRNPSFNTLRGIVRDGKNEADPDGFPRSIPRREPPLITRTDPATNISRYMSMTRDAGPIVNGRNAGLWGYGNGVYVSGDPADRGDAQDEDERVSLGGNRSLVRDWLNPNKQVTSRSGGWKGPFYVPRACYMRLTTEGFVITRDASFRPPFNQWQYMTNRGGAQGGQPSNQRTVSFRLVTLPDLIVPTETTTYLINSLVSPDLMSQPTASLPAARVRAEGRQFNGVIYFENDVRVRGEIPTDQQLTIVTMGSIYIEGSITKGVRIPGTTNVLNRPSRSMLGLFAKDYVAVNTTMFFGLQPDQEVTSKVTTPGTQSQSVLDLLGNEGKLNLYNQFILNNSTDPAVTANANDPATWRPFATTYQEYGANSAIFPHMLLQHAADSGGPSYVKVNIRPQTAGNPLQAFAYRFLTYDRALAQDPVNAFNADISVRSTVGLNPGDRDRLAIYGVTNPNAAYPNIETISFPLVEPQSTFQSAASQIAPNGSATGQYTLAVTDETEFEIQATQAGVSTKNYLFGRAAVVPHDVRIEAVIYAQEGSFFVIPGPTMNEDKDDTRDRFNQAVAATNLVTAQRDRYERYGNMPEVSFYGEPMNVRITIVGAVSENMPATMSQQSQWQRLWGWMPRQLAGTGRLAPRQHNSFNQDLTVNATVLPNILMQYDPSLAFASPVGDSVAGPTRSIPIDPANPAVGRWVLPPVPRLPVSSTLAYFGEVNP
jgi:type II secretory pathway pseudopilin PulG